MSEMASKNNIDDKELQDLIDKRIEEKKEEIKAEAKKELQEMRPDSNSVTNNSKALKGISRRDFLKKAGLGSVGLMALGIPSTSALNLESNSLTFSNSERDYLSIDTAAEEVNIQNADLVLNSRNITGANELELPVSEASADNRIWLDVSNKELKVKISGKIYTSEIQPAILNSEHLHAHWDATKIEKNGDAKNDGDKINTWTDQVGSNNLSSIANGAPTYKTNAKNGLPAVEASRAEGMDVTYGADKGQPVQYMAVFKYNDDSPPSSARAILDAGDSSRNEARRILFSAVPGDGDNWALGADGGIGTISGGSIDKNWHIVTVLAEGANSYIKIDGVQVASGNAGSRSMKGAQLFVEQELDGGAAAIIGERLDFTGSLTNSEENAFERHLSDKWGISI